jgi:hypothetical protein
MPYFESIKKHKHFLLSLVVATTPFLLIVMIVPPNMDEFIHYQVLSCLEFPASNFNVFQSPCGAYDLSVMGHYLPLRSWHYIGSSPAFFYYPFFKILNHFIIVRLLDVFCIAALLWVFVRGLKLNLLVSSLVIGSFLPLVFQTAIDTGPVSFQISMLFLVPYMTSRIRTWQQSILVGLLVFLAFWHKPLFILFVPAMIIMFIIFYRFIEGHRCSFIDSVRLLKVLWPGALLSAVLILILLSAKDRSNHSYYEILLSKSTNIPVFDFSRQWQFFIEKFLRFLTNFSNFSHRVFGFSSKLDLSTAFFWLTSLPMIIWSIAKTDSRKVGALLLLITLLNGFLINRNLKSWAGHHYIFGLIFYLTATCWALDKCFHGRKKLSVFLASVIYISNFCGVLFSITRPPKPHSTLQNIQIIEALQNEQLANRFMYVFLDWGMNFTQALFGHQNQLVTYNYPYTKHGHSKIYDVLNATNREALYITLAPNSPDKGDLFKHRKRKLIEVKLPKVSNGPWKFFVDENSVLPH